MTDGNPQVENGHIQIATELWEALTRYRLPGEEMKCFMYVIRKTYGWKKKADNIPLSQFEKACDMQRSSVVRALNGLVTKKLLHSHKKVTPIGKSLATSYSINKKYDTWAQIKKRNTSKNRGYKKVNLGSYKKVNRVVTKKSHSIDTSTKETITKDIREQKIYAFYRDNVKPDNLSSVRAKDYIKRLLKKHSEQDLIQTISNYNKKANGRDPEYRKDPANFFSPKHKYYLDYLPGNFVKPKSEEWTNYSH